MCCVWDVMKAVIKMMERVDVGRGAAVFCLNIHRQLSVGLYTEEM